MCANVRVGYADPIERHSEQVDTTMATTAWTVKTEPAPGMLALRRCVRVRESQVCVCPHPSVVPSRRRVEEPEHESPPFDTRPSDRRKASATRASPVKRQRPRSRERSVDRDRPRVAPSTLRVSPTRRSGKRKPTRSLKETRIEQTQKELLKQDAKDQKCRDDSVLTQQAARRVLSNLRRSQGSAGGWESSSC